MDKLIQLYDSFNRFNTNSQLSVFLIIPVITVVIGAILVFICGFRKAEQPKFKKLSDNAKESVTAAASKNQKQKKKSSAYGGNNQSNQSGNVQKNNTVNSTAGPKKSLSQNKKSSGVTASSSQSLSTQQMTTLTVSVGKKADANPSSKKDNHNKKSSSNATTQGLINKSTLRKKISDPVKNLKDDTAPAKKSKINGDKQQMLESEGWQTVQSRTDKKNKKTENEVSSPLTNKLSAIGITVRKSSPKIKQNEPTKANKHLFGVNAAKTDEASAVLTKSKILDNLESHNNNNENDQNLENVLEMDKKLLSTTITLPAAIGSNNFSIPQHMTSEDLAEFVRSRTAAASAKSDLRDLSCNAASKIGNAEAAYRIEDKNPNAVMDKLMEHNIPSSNKINIQNNSKLGSSKPGAAAVTLSFFENEKLLIELDLPTNNAKENVAFDELEDAWTETKTQKKNKRRVRKE